VQDTWLRVIRSARTFDGRSSVKTWLYRILINRCKDLRAARRPLQPDSRGREPNALDPTIGPAEPFADDSQALRAAVESLREDRRTIVLLCYHAGVTHEHAAEILGLPLGTLKSRLHAALTQLRAALAPEPSR
jgi:RNA polymerase sigma-70 factor, ECF subfamily